MASNEDEKTVRYNITGVNRILYASPETECFSVTDFLKVQVVLAEKNRTEPGRLGYMFCGECLEKTIVPFKIKRKKEFSCR